jgi:hypothetical protein
MGNPKPSCGVRLGFTYTAPKTVTKVLTGR